MDVVTFGLVVGLSVAGVWAFFELVFFDNSQEDDL